MISVEAHLVFFTPELRKYVDEKTANALSKFGAYVRKEARDLIRRQKKPSKPGNPPSSPTGRLKKSILFFYDKKAKSVVIGPIKFSGVQLRQTNKPVPAVLEYGGKITLKTIKPPQIGDFGPIRISRRPISGSKVRKTVTYVKGRKVTWYVARAKLKTSEQVERARELLEKMYPGRVSASVKWATIKERPYMRVAFRKVLSKLKDIFEVGGTTNAVST